MLDLRLAVRALRATPVVSAIAIISLALGIGANAAMFTLVNSLLLRSLPVRQPERLALVTGPAFAGARGAPASAWSYPIWDEIRRRPELFDGTAAWAAAPFNLAAGGETRYADGLWVNGRFFDTLGVPAILGRMLTDADDRRGSPDGPVAVISYTFWQQRFGGAADAIGRTLTLDGVPFTVVGVAPPDFFGPEVGRTFDVAVPFGAEPLLRGRDSALDRRSQFWVFILARMKPGQTADAATAALRGVQPQIREATMPEYPRQRDREAFLANGLSLVPAGTGTSRLRAQYERPLVTIMVVVALVLLIACANIANLLLARATARRHELSVRVALGATRWRLARQLLVESALLAAAGAALGLIVASWTSRVLVQQLSSQVNHVFLDLSLDWRVFAFTVAIAIVTALLFGTAPALRASAAAPIDALKEQNRGGAFSTRGGVANGLVVLQVALSVVLVVAAGLFVRTFASLATRSLGFDRNGVMTVTVNAQRVPTGAQVIAAPGHPTPAAAERIALFGRVRDAVTALPGVAHAAISVVTPVSGLVIQNRIDVSDGIALPDSERATSVNFISAGWFQTFHTAVVAGRDLTDGDKQGSAPVAIVNQAFARKFLNGANPLGHTVSVAISGPRPWGAPPEIVGVVEDAVYRSLREPAPPTLYLPIAQHEEIPPFILGSIVLSVRSSGSDPAMLTKSIAAAIAGVNPQLALAFRPLADQVNASLAQERIVAMLSGFFGALALLMAGLGLYGVTAYAVGRRRGEIGIRVALGAQSGGVVRLFLVRVGALIAGGIALGAAASVWLARFVGALLYGLQPRDPLTFAAAAVTLAVVGALAAWIPARRAANIDPAEVLREA